MLTPIVYGTATLVIVEVESPKSCLALPGNISAYGVETRLPLEAPGAPKAETFAFSSEQAAAACCFLVEEEPFRRRGD